MRRLFFVGFCLFIGSHLIGAADDFVRYCEDKPFVIIQHREIRKTCGSIGCEVGRSFVKTGVFLKEAKGAKMRLALEYVSHTDSISDFTSYMNNLILDLKSRYSITVHKVGIAAPGIPDDEKNYLKFEHLPFDIDGDALTKTTGVTTKIFNDFQALGYGIATVADDQTQVVHQGEQKKHGKKIVVGAGGGLGTSQMLWNIATSSYDPYPLNYSCTEFGAQTEEELDFKKFLEQKKGCSAWSKVLGSSGGILVMYDFLQQRKKYKKHTYEDYQQVFASRGKDPCAQEAVHFFMKLYARMVRNLAYAHLPEGGVYVVNDVALCNPELFDKEWIKGVLRPNCDNSYLENILQKTPIKVLKTDAIKMYGAMQAARAQLSKKEKQL